MTSNAIQPQSELQALLTEWRAYLADLVAADELADTSRQGYSRGADKYLSWAVLAGMDPRTAETMRTWKAAMKEAGQKPATVNAWQAGAKAFFRWLVEAKGLPLPPAATTRGAKRTGTTTHHKREILTYTEVARLLAMPDPATTRGKRDAAILCLMVYTAVRTVEVQRADLGDLETRSGRLVLNVHGKGRQEADELVVIAHPDAQAALYDWLAIRGKKPGPLFTSLSPRTKGGRLSSRALRSIIAGYFHAAGITSPNKTAHSLRHTAITEVIIKSGGDILKAQKLARHKDSKTTLIYLHETNRLEDPPEAYITYKAEPGR